MKIETYEGAVENGQIRLAGDVRLPEIAKVYVVIPGVEARPVACIGGSRLVHTEQAADFKKEIIERSLRDHREIIERSLRDNSMATGEGRIRLWDEISRKTPSV